MSSMADGSSRDQGRAGGSRVTMAAVGRMAGVSQVTVSRALSDPSKVSPETLRRIREAIEATGFVPNAVAGALASSRSRLISALVPSITNITYTSFIKEFTDRVREHDYQVLLTEYGFDREDEETTISRHLSRRPDAMLLTGINHTAQARRILLGAGIPVVEIWELTDSPIDICVGFSHHGAGREVAEFAIEAGYHQAATVSANDERALRRAAAFAETFTRKGGARVEAVNLPAQASLAAGRAGLSELVGRIGGSPGVVFCSSDLIAQGILVEARARGYDVPGDIAVIGFGDQEFAAHLDPPLTTVRVDRSEMGRIAAGAMLDRLGPGGGGETIYDLGFEVVRRATA